MRKSVLFFGFIGLTLRFFNIVDFGMSDAQVAGFFMALVAMASLLDIADELEAARKERRESQPRQGGRSGTGTV